MGNNDDTNGVPPGYFDVFKYGESNGAGGAYIDGPDALANNSQMVVSFQHEPSATQVFFKAFIIAFNETYASDWVGESVFGRTDPIQLFKQTSRRIALALKVPAATHGEAFDNLARVQQLIQFLYPNYEKVGAAQTIAQNPFVRMKVMNLARSTADFTVDPTETKRTAAESYKKIYTEYKSTADPNKGLLGVITSLTVNHNLDNPAIGVLAKERGSSNLVLPKMIELNLDFTVIHEETLGWINKQEGTPGAFNNSDPYFPYGVKISGKGLAAYAEQNTNETVSKLPKGVSQQNLDDAKARFSGWWPESRWKTGKELSLDPQVGTMAADITALQKKGDLRSLRKAAALQADLDYFRSAQIGINYYFQKAGGQLGDSGYQDWTPPNDYKFLG